MPKPSAKLQRWTDLLVELLRRTYPVPFEELAEAVPGYRTASSEAGRRRTFERDKDELRRLGVPLRTVVLDGETTGYALKRTEFYLPYLALRGSGRPPRRASRHFYQALATLDFEPDELEAVARAAARVAALGDPVLAECAADAVRKLAVDLPIDAVHPPEPVRMRVAPLPREQLEVIDEALSRRKRLTFSYEAVAAGGTSRREVEPLGLFFVSHHWYLAAREPGGSTVKNFRVSRMRDVAMNVSAPQNPDFAPPAGFRLAEHARSRQAWELGDGDAVEALVRFTGEGGAVRAAARLGAAVPGAPDTRRFLIRRLDAFSRWLLSFGGDAVPLEPPALRAALRDLAAATAGSRA